MSPTRTEVKFGIFAPVVSKKDGGNDLSDFLNVGYDLSLNEPETVQWFAFKYSHIKPSTFAIFDTFTSTNGRDAHLSGPIAAALLENADSLLSQPPEINNIDILASVVDLSKGAGGGGKTEGLKVGLRVLIEAKPEKREEVKNFLIGARSLVLDEAKTPVWYAVHFPETDRFGIVDFFGSEEGRNAHLAGKVAEALFGSADDLLTTPPDVVKFSVLAAKV